MPKRGCGGIGRHARLRGVWLCHASSILAIRIVLIVLLRLAPLNLA